MNQAKLTRYINQIVEGGQLTLKDIFCLVFSICGQGILLVKHSR